MNEPWASSGQKNYKESDLLDDFTNNVDNNPTDPTLSEVFYDDEFTSFDPVDLPLDREQEDVHLSQFCSTTPAGNNTNTENIHRANILEVDKAKKKTDQSLPFIYPIKLYYPTKKHAMVIRQGKKKDKSGIEYDTVVFDFNYAFDGTAHSWANKLSVALTINELIDLYGGLFGHQQTRANGLHLKFHKEVRSLVINWASGGTYHFEVRANSISGEIHLGGRWPEKILLMSMVKELISRFYLKFYPNISANQLDSLLQQY